MICEKTIVTVKMLDKKVFKCQPAEQYKDYSH